MASSRCHWIDIDALRAATNGERILEYLTPGGAPGAYEVAAGVTRALPAGSRATMLPFPLTAIVAAPGDPGGPAATRTRVLAELLAALGVHDGEVVAVAELPGAVLQDVAWSPNPFNPRTTVRFALAREARVTVNLYDLRGRRLRHLHDGPLVAGGHALTWDGSGRRRSSCPRRHLPRDGRGRR